MTVPVAVAMLGDGESAVAAAVDSHPTLVLVRRCVDLAEALALAQAGVVALVVVSDQPRLNRAVLADFSAAGVAVVAVGTNPAAVRELSGLGIENVASADADASTIADLAASVALALAPLVLPPRQRAPNDGHGGVVIAVWGPTGAPGRTTLAVNIAAECADAEGDALVVDVDTYGGAVAQALGLLDEAPGIAALARASLHGSLTDDVVWRHLQSVSPGFKVLSGITRADRWPELSRSALEDIWPLLRKHNRVTVVDCGFSIAQDEDAIYDTRAPQRNGATLSALENADVIVVVGTSEPLGIQRLVQASAELDSVVSVTCPRIIVANRVRSSVAGSNPESAIADALARYSGIERVWMVPYDGKSCDAATLAGQTLRERVPRSVARRGIRSVAKAAVEIAHSASEPLPSPRESARAEVPALTD